MSGAIGIDYDVKRVTMAARVNIPLEVSEHLTRDNYWHIGESCTSSSEQILESLQWLKSHAKATHVALEKPWLKRWKDKDTREDKVAPQAHAQLWRVYGRIEVLCEQVGLVVVPAPPTTWQAAMLTPRGGKLGNRDDRKALSILVAKELGADIKSDHEADAVCMVEWLGKRLALEEREVKG